MKVYPLPNKILRNVQCQNGTVVDFHVKADTSIPVVLWVKEQINDLKNFFLRWGI